MPRAKVTVPILRLPHSTGLPLPSYSTPQAAALDLPAALTEALTIEPGATALIPTGIALGLPSGYEAQIRPRSGLAATYQVTVLNSPGTIDADYRGELQVVLINHGKSPFHIERGMRIAQLVIVPLPRVHWAEVTDLPSTSRSVGGFGHTGE